MKFEGTRYRPSGTVPDFFREFLDHYSLLIRWALNITENRFRFSEDIRVFTVDLGLNHGEELSIPHKLGYPPAQVSFTGRVEMLNIVSRSPTNIVVKPKLLTTAIIDPQQGRLVQRITVADPTLFKLDDTVKIGTATRKIRLIQGNVITLNESVLHDSVYSLALANELTSLIMC